MWHGRGNFKKVSSSSTEYDEVGDLVRLGKIPVSAMPHEDDEERDALISLLDLGGVDPETSSG